MDGCLIKMMAYIYSRLGICGKKMASSHVQFYVKASFLEIYNEQLRDLLNPASGILHARWNAKNGFFVEDLMVVECTSI